MTRIEYAVQHQELVTVHHTGHAFRTKESAIEEADSFNGDCEWCTDDGFVHKVVERDVSEWRESIRPEIERKRNG